MENPLFLRTISFSIFLLRLLGQTLALDTPCKTTCGSIQVKYPFGTGTGCGSPRFYPYVACSAAGDQFLLTTHTGSYPITSISYTTSTITITPPTMSTCNSMRQSPNFGLDWASPFQIGPSTFLLLSCPPPTSSLTMKGSPVCDTSSSYLCASIYTCPAVIGLGLPLFAPTNTCCVYSPANFNGKGELDLHLLKCLGYTSIAGFHDYPTDPTRWEYGVVLNYKSGAYDDFYIDNKCNTCEISGGICGYGPPGDSFLCLCNGGINTTTDCNGHSQDLWFNTWSSNSRPSWKIWLGIFSGLVLIGTA
ncbi:hypothetical protein JCGZ_18635 [Jatropha curcas]|uniref:Wall-associated receptor kinase galacturonan-binding domain-containing protein n=1 Tax=Jatropha curcas TaxID=180498 RepID=A0A067KBU8_JATCU|nr:uncharacterized protein LOC105641623 [Jatropha curcas]XP_037492351.1 uncharacterized protein LOC119369106 [Jatropha curcas]KDP29700.1 hypothetical protein JCGZ_18635 [Jatropha curcas]